MPKRTDISSILIIGAGPFTPSPRRGEGAIRRPGTKVQGSFLVNA